MVDVKALREKLLDCLAADLAHDNIGFYPQKTVHADGREELRTEHQNGWNECAMQHTKYASAASRWLSSLPADVKPLVEDLLIEEKLRLNLRAESGVQPWVICNDLFFWGCADGEDISLEELPQLIECHTLSPKFGGDLWCCRKREMRPQAAMYKYIPRDEWPLFDAAGPERDDPDGKRRDALPVAAT